MYKLGPGIQSMDVLLECVSGKPTESSSLEWEQGKTSTTQTAECSSWSVTAQTVAETMTKVIYFSVALQALALDLMNAKLFLCGLDAHWCLGIV